MILSEASTVENLIRNPVCGGMTHDTAACPGLARRNATLSGLGWKNAVPAQIPRQPNEGFVQDWVVGSRRAHA